MSSLEVKKITYLSHEDHSIQPAFVCVATGNEKKTLSSVSSYLELWS